MEAIKGNTIIKPCCDFWELVLCFDLCYWNCRSFFASLVVYMRVFITRWFVLTNKSNTIHWNNQQWFKVTTKCINVVLKILFVNNLFYSFDASTRQVCVFVNHVRSFVVYLYYINLMFNGNNQNKIEVSFNDDFFFH